MSRLSCLTLLVALGCSEDPPILDDTDPTDSGTDSGTDDTGDTSDTDWSGYDFTGYSEVSDAGSAIPGGDSVAIAPDGTLYVSWVDDRTDSWKIYLARSTDGGETFGPATFIDVMGEPAVSQGRRPYVAADNDRVAVTYTTPSAQVAIYVADAGPSPSFGAPITVGDGVGTFKDYAMVGFLPSGTLWVVYHGYDTDSAGLYLAREDNAWALQPVSATAPGEPCECCSLDFMVDSDGDGLVAFRNNDGNLREMWLARTNGSPSFATSAISDSEGTVEICPMEGPRLTQTGSDAYAAVWASRGTPTYAKVLLATTTDGGASWSNEEVVSAFTEGSTPDVVYGSSGTFYVVAVTGNNRSTLTSGAVGSWSTAELLVSPDGPIARPLLAANAGIVALSGVTEAGTVWVKVLE